MEAEWSKALSQIQVERMPQVPSSDLAWGMYLNGTVMDPLYTICKSLIKNSIFGGNAGRWRCATLYVICIMCTKDN